MEQVTDLAQVGAVMTKGLTLEPRIGNPTPRIVETPSGMLNAIGLQNDGVKKFISHKLPYLREHKIPVIANINGSSVGEYEKLAAILSDADGVGALEVNISCPNVKKGGIEFGVDPVACENVLTRIRKATPLTLIVKLSPNVTQIADFAKIVEATGCDAISLVNTFVGMAVDVEKRKPVLANVTGGLSGPAIRPIAVRMAWQVARAVKIPIIGMGGIESLKDALEFFIVGATAISIGTANFYNPRLANEIVAGLEKYLADRNLNDIKQLVGTLKVESK
jgi:dihydroorotate dehydrogenase (NAD+) catalytic subunit